MELATRVTGVFVPLSTTSPIIIKAKIRLRKLGQDGLQWTDVVGGEDRNWWLLWFKQLRRLNDVAMPRRLFPDRSNLEASALHTFWDASEKAYATVIYVWSLFSNGQVVVRQVKATNKLAPKKTISVPKLELNAALLCAKITKAMQTALLSHFRRRQFWTDSNVRNWIRAAASDYQVFVSNGVGELQTITEADEWRFLPGRLNPVDAATQSTLDGDIFSEIWWSGLNWTGQQISNGWRLTTKQNLFGWSLLPKQLRWTSVQILESNVSQLCGLRISFSASSSSVKRSHLPTRFGHFERRRRSTPLHIF